MAGVKVKPADAYVVAAEPVVLIDPTTGAPYAASGGGGGGGAVTIADGADVAEGSTADAAWTGVGNSTVVASLKTIATAALDTTPAAVIGGTAADAALTADPVTTGGLAKTANPTAVADGDVVNELHDKLGKVIAVSAIRELKGVQKTTIANTTETTIITAAASTFHDLYGLIIANTSATATSVAIKDATAGTTRMNIAIPAGQTAGFMLDAGSAVTQAVVNNNWTATAAASVTSLEITALYVKNT